MAILFDVIVLAILLLIAAELFAIQRALTKLSSNLPSRLESKEGQTINVNLGQLPVASVPAEAASERVETKEAEAPKPDAPAVVEAEPEPEPEPPPPPPPRPSAGMRATPSGLTALKCPKCQAENSSYRSECFNCGEKLK